MNNWLYLSIFGLLFAIIALWTYSKVRASRNNKPHPEKIQSFHCITIYPCPGACENVKQLCGKKFLASEAPILPVPGCTAKQCRCAYQHYDDRRSGKDRRHEYIEMERAASENEHRAKNKPDRRQQD
ncbi:hypothetical protein [Methylophaga sp. OBS4]|uniref:hypothetical protein n=1 Tax=Methylophaga sp. OBS4 TaxID=2991935 RepID=UPI00224FDF19|nr:hypothetical protein [Methylophaga sp. OBS4]MCX4186987.1 hypothetical protein [Methylophaga sp. OBS4]